MGNQKLRDAFGAGTGRFMPTAQWPVYADSALAGLCRLRSRLARPQVAGLRRLRSGRFMPVVDSLVKHEVAVRVERAGEAAQRGGLANAGLAGEQAPSPATAAAS